MIDLTQIGNFRFLSPFPPTLLLPRAWLRSNRSSNGRFVVCRLNLFVTATHARRKRGARTKGNECVGRRAEGIKCIPRPQNPSCPSACRVRVREMHSANGDCNLNERTNERTNERGKEQDQPATHGDRTRHVQRKDRTTDAGSVREWDRNRATSDQIEELLQRGRKRGEEETREQSKTTVTKYQNGRMTITTTTDIVVT